MSRLTEALSRYVDEQTPGAVPPFTTVQRRIHQRARLRGLVASIAVLLVSSAVALLVAGDRSAPVVEPTSGYRVDGPPPQRMRVNFEDLVLEGEVPFRHPRLDVRDPSVLMLDAGPDEPDTHGGCIEYVTARILEQDATHVRVGAFAYRMADPIVSPCVQPGYPTKVHRLALGVPLDGRTVYSGTTPVTVLDPVVLLTPTYLPDGYQAPGTLFFWGDRVDAPAWRFPGPDRGWLEVALASPAAEREPLPEDVLARPVVRGHAAVAFRNGAYQTCLQWREAPDLLVVICSHGDSPASWTDLVPIAEGLRRGQPR